MFRSRSARRVLNQYVLAFGLLFAVFTAGTATVEVERADAQQSVLAQVTPLEEESEEAPGLGVIVGTPEAGPEPEDAGDRGGFAQLGLAIVLFVAIGFIASRVVKGARAAA